MGLGGLPLPAEYPAPVDPPVIACAAVSPPGLVTFSGASGDVVLPGPAATCTEITFASPVWLPTILTVAVPASDIDWAFILTSLPIFDFWAGEPSNLIIFKLEIERLIPGAITPPLYIPFLIISKVVAVPKSIQWC